MKIDCQFCTAGVQTTVLEELTRQCEIRFLNVDGEGAGRLLSAYPAYETYVIPADTYSGQAEEVSTVGVKALLLASDKLSAKTVKQITGLLSRTVRNYSMLFLWIWCLMNLPPPTEFLFPFTREPQTIIKNAALT